MKTVKGLLKKTEDPYLALLAHRSTPLENGYSQAELLMGRKLRTIIPVITTQLHPRLLKISEQCKWLCVVLTLLNLEGGVSDCSSVLNVD